MAEDNKSFFFDEWRDCLRSHYRYVVQTHDEITEPTLRSVLHDAGVSEEEVERWLQETLQQMQDDADYSTQAES